MTLVKRNGSLLHPLPLLFDDFFNKDFFNWGNQNYSATNTTVPSVNIRETGDYYEVEVAAPGMAREDFAVELDGNTLSIRSEKNNRRESHEEDRYVLKEYNFQSFHRTFNLQKDVVDTEKIQAKYADGILQLLIPKKEEAKQKPPRRIQIA